MLRVERSDVRSERFIVVLTARARNLDASAWYLASWGKNRRSFLLILVDLFCSSLFLMIVFCFVWFWFEVGKLSRSSGARSRHRLMRWLFLMKPSLRLLKVFFPRIGGLILDREYFFLILIYRVLSVWRKCRSRRNKEASQQACGAEAQWRFGDDDGMHWSQVRKMISWFDMHLDF